MSPKPNKATDNPPPKHLTKRAAEFWKALNEKFVFEPSDLEKLRTACELIGTIDECEAAVKRDGLFTLDRYKQPKAHPAVAVSRDSRTLLLRSLRELGVDIEAPTESRVPRQSRRYS